MAHRYDTGLAIPQRTALRNAIIDRLGTLRRPAMYLMAVRPLPRRVTGDEDGIADIMNALGGQAPAMLVGLGNATHSAAGAPASRARKSLDVGVYVISGHGRGVVEGRMAGDTSATTDNARDPGVETMLEHAEELLLGRDLGVAGVSELRAEAETEIYSGDDFTIWELAFSVQISRDINHSRLVTQLLTEIDSQYSVVDSDVGNPVFVTRTPIEGS